MANENHDPWALLREARDFMRQAAISRGPCPDCTECDYRDAIIAKADAALAAHDAVPPLPADEQDGDGWRIDGRERYEGTTLCAVWRANDRWCWQTITQGAVTEDLGYANTLDEAKAAAIAAARGMR